MGVQAREIAYQSIGRLGVGQSDARASGTKGQLIGCTVVALVPVAAQQAQSRLVAQSQRAVEVEGGSQAIFPHVAAAIVVCLQPAADQRAGAGLDAQVRGSLRLARQQGAFGLEAGNVAQEQKRTLQLRALDRGISFECAQGAE